MRSAHSNSLDHLVGALLERPRHVETEGFRRFEGDPFGGQLHVVINRLLQASVAQFGPNRLLSADHAALSICMKSLIFRRARFRSGFRFASMQIPEKNAVISSHKELTSIFGLSKVKFPRNSRLSDVDGPNAGSGVLSPSSWVEAVNRVHEAAAAVSFVFLVLLPESCFRSPGTAIDSCLNTTPRDPRMSHFIVLRAKSTKARKVAGNCLRLG